MDRESREELLKENALLKEILDRVHEGIFATDENDQIIIYNKEVERTDGLSRNQVLGQKEEEVYAFCPGYHFNDLVARRLKSLKRSIYDQRYEYVMPDGRKINILFDAHPFFYQGKLAAVYTIGRAVDRISDFIAKTLELQKQINIEHNRLKTGTHFFLDDIIGTSDKIRDCIALARKVAGHKSPVLILGETGTGKELFAQGIHNASIYAAGPFVPINCAALPEALLEGLLFGTVKGAFTGALDMPGLFEQAQGGSLFLDEINSMPLSLQSRLLRVLQDKKIRRLGSKEEIPVNCRIISAANTDLWQQDQNAVVRSDLLFRLATVTLQLPPLRQRQEDIEVLALHFIRQLNAEFGLFLVGLDAELVRMMNNYSWSGNVRELNNVIESAMNLVEVDEKLLQFKHIPAYFQDRIKAASENKTVSPVVKGNFRQLIRAYEKELIETALQNNGGNVTYAARDLQMMRQNLHNKMRHFGLKSEAYISEPEASDIW